MKLGMVMATAGAFAASFSFAGEAPKVDPAKGQQIVAQVCVACHGADGNSATPANPSLAGQHPEYLVKQLQEFKKGVRKNAIMQGMAATLSEDDMRNVAAFLGAQKPKLVEGSKPASQELGKKIYMAGNPVTGVPACASCHGPKGSGMPAQFPRLAGQSAEYVTAQMQAFRKGERANDPASTMQQIAAKMNDKEIEAVSNYVVGLR